MRRLSTATLVTLTTASMLYPQGRPLDWPTFGNDAQRSGWERVDTRITKDNVKDFTLVLKHHFDGPGGGARSMSAPVVIGLLISYKGFKELAFVSAAGDNVWALDVDVDRVFWHKPLGAGMPVGAGPCAGIVATPSLTPPANFGQRPGRPGAPGAPGARPAAPPPAPNPNAPVSANPALGQRALLGSTGFGAPRPAFVVTSDGRLHALNTSTGDEVAPAMPYIPSGAKASVLTVSNGALYTVTREGCGDGPAGVYAIDLSGDVKGTPVASYPLKGGAVGLAGLAFGTDGTVYAQTPSSLVALSAKELKLEHEFAFPSSGSAGTTPVFLSYKGKDTLVTAGPDGKLYVLDAKNLKVLAQTSQAEEFHGGVSTWEAEGTRWILAPTKGAVAALKLEGDAGKPTLTPAWTSRAMVSPQPVVIAGGAVFALAAGDRTTAAKLYALDGVTGKELYSTGDQVKAPANHTGVTVANGRVFFSTVDNTLWGFGIFMER